MSRVAFCFFIFNLVKANIIKIDVADNDFDNHKSLTKHGVKWSNEHIMFKVKGCRDCNVLLKSTSKNYHFFIGGWGNTRSVLTIKIPNVGYDEVSIKDNFVALDCDNFKEFWISWNKGKIQAGKGNILHTDVFLSFEEIAPFPVTDIEISVQWDATNTYLFNVTDVPLCPCSCEYKKRLEHGKTNSSLLNHTMDEWRLLLADVTAEIKRNLSINASTTSASIRRRTSAPDDRISSKSGGILGIIIISLVLSSFIFIDIVRLKRHLAICTMYSQVNASPSL